MVIMKNAVIQVVTRHNSEGAWRFRGTYCWAYHLLLLVSWFAYSLTLKMEAICSSTFPQTARRYNPEDHTLQPDWCFCAAPDSTIDLVHSDYIPKCVRSLLLNSKIIALTGTMFCLTKEWEGNYSDLPVWLPNLTQVSATKGKLELPKIC
jgi:hypothetical protein